MVEHKTEILCYETDIISKVTCDICESDITNEEFFKLDVSFIELNEQKTQYRNVYEQNNGHSHICKECAKNILIFIPSKPITEYIEDNLI